MISIFIISLTHSLTHSMLNKSNYANSFFFLFFSFFLFFLVPCLSSLFFCPVFFFFLSFIHLFIYLCPSHPIQPYTAYLRILEQLKIDSSTKPEPRRVSPCRGDNNTEIQVSYLSIILCTCSSLLFSSSSAQLCSLLSTLCLLLAACCLV